MSNLAEELQTLKKQEAESKEKLTRLQGRQEQLMSQLKSDFGCSTVEEGEEKLASLQKDIEKRESRAKSLIADIKKARDEGGN